MQSKKDIPSLEALSLIISAHIFYFLHHIRYSTKLARKYLKFSLQLIFFAEHEGNIF